MNISIGTLFPHLYTDFFSTSIIKRAIANSKIAVTLHNMFDSVPAKKRIDSDIVGHGSGMLLGVTVIEAVYNQVVEKTKKKPYTIFFSPHGKQLDQDRVKKIHLAIADRPLLLFAGRYEGFDVRAEEKYADDVVSIGDYVLFGGDLPVMVFLEAFLRLIPGVVGKPESVENDSFSHAFLDCPHYAAPDIWHDKKIPSILKSGNHKEIATWRLKESIKRTINSNWQWLMKHLRDNKDKKMVKAALPNHYAVLLHNNVMLPGGLVGNSTVTSIDIHDIARSSATYGISKYFIVTAIQAQQKLVQRFLDFWHNKETNSINPSRAFALQNVGLKSDLKEAVEEIAAKEGKPPVIIVTSSRRNISHDNLITFHDQEKIWALARPVLFVFGTAHGIDPFLMETFDYKLIPLEGLEEFNFLSVRSAAAIVFDRWLGLNSVKK